MHIARVILLYQRNGSYDMVKAECIKKFRIFIIVSTLVRRNYISMLFIISAPVVSVISVLCACCSLMSFFMRS